MTQDTKIGLVVGMGFIICFAVILANRRTGERVSSQLPYRLFQEHSPAAASGGGAVPERQAALLAQQRPSVLPPASPNAEPPSRSDPLPASAALKPSPARNTTRRDRVPMADPERFTRRRPPVSKGVDLSAPTLTQAPRERGSATLPARATLAAAPPASVPQSAGDPSEGEGTGADSGLPAGLAGHAHMFTRVRQGSTAGRAKAAPVAHVVQAGDTLTGLARRYYGQVSQSTLQELYKANRGTMTSPDDVQIGTRLVLPVLDGVGPKLPGAPVKLARNTKTPKASPRSPAAKTQERPREEPSAAWRWYMVKKGDVLGTIAQQQLGSAKRWRKILELNEDICPTARDLKYGMKIRVPVDRLADAR